MNTENANVLTQNKDIVAIVLGIVGILLIPAIAMQFTSEVNWGSEDFIVIGAILSVAGSMYVLVNRKFHKHRLAIGMAILFAVVWLWAELAVGIFTNWGS